MKKLWRYLEQWSHGVLLGACIGLLAGLIEFYLYFVGKDYAGNLAWAYWDTMLYYAIVGVIGGLAAVLPQLHSHGHFGGAYFARLGTTLLSLVIFSYLVLWITYAFFPKLSWLVLGLAYGASAILAIGIGRLLYLIIRRIGTQQGSSASNHLRIRVPLLLLAVMTCVLFFPHLFLAERQTEPGQVAALAQNREGQPRPNIVVILIDTLRADHLPMYGYSRQTAPTLSKLAQQGVLFTRMYAPSSTTRPSVATVFSSLYPAVHKVNHEDSFLSDAFVTLAELLHAAGYQTFGVSANSNVSPTFGYAQGFETFRASSTERPIWMTMLGSAIETVFRRILNRDVSDFFRERLEIVPRAEAITDVTLQWASKHHTKPTFSMSIMLTPMPPIVLQSLMIKHLIIVTTLLGGLETWIRSPSFRLSETVPEHAMPWISMMAKFSIMTGTLAAFLRGSESWACSAMPW